MRFQQLKDNPNNILRKKLVKSGKNWIIIASLSIIGGILFSGSATTVNADPVSNQPTVTQNSNASLNQSKSLPIQDPSENNPAQNSPANNQAPTPEVKQPITSATEKANLNQEPAKSESQPQQAQTSIQQANVPTVSTKTAGDTESTVPAGIDGTVTEQGKDGTSNYFITDKGTLYFTDGSLDKDATQAIGLKHSNDVLAVDTSLAGPNSVYAPEDSSYLFAGDTNTTSDYWSQLKTLNLTNLNTSNVTNMSHMFYYLSWLSNIDISKLDTSNVTDMSSMFAVDSQLTSLNVSSFNTKKVTDMSSMFQGILNTKSIDLSNFDTSNVTNMNQMFGDSYMTSLNLSNFNTSKVTNMGAMFGDMDFLQTLDISNFDTSNLKEGGTYNTRIFLGVSLSKITLGPKAKFDIKFSNYPRFREPITDGPNKGMVASYWVNSVNGKEGNLKYDEDKLLTDYKPKPNETETFILGGLHYDNVTLNENDYLNDSKKPYLTSPLYPIRIIVTDLSTEDVDQIKNPSIPSNWKLDDDKSNITFSLNGTDMAFTINQLKTALETEPTPYKNLPINLKNITKILSMRLILAKNGTCTLNMYYTGKLPSNNLKPSSNSNHDYLPITSLIQTVATFADKPSVQLWSFDRNTSSITPVTNRELAPDSDWYSDRMVTVDNIDYLRVATNEWVKSSDVYRYIANPTTIIVNDNSQRFAPLFKAEGTNVTDRTLSNGSNWYSDYIAYLGKNDDTKQSNDSQDKYYRVATNEFVKTDDTTE